MGRKREPNEKSSYTKAPEGPAALAERMTLVCQVIGQSVSMSEGARRAGIRRNNFQAVVNRAKNALVEALSPRPSGPSPVPERERQLRAENERLTRQTEQLWGRLETIERLLGVAGGMARGQIKTRSSRRSSPSSTSSSTGTSEDPEPAAILSTVTTMTEAGVPRGLAAQALGFDPSTERRWRRNLENGDPARQRSRSPALDAARAAEARRRVEKLGRLIGADALAKGTGVTRRQAAAIKREVLAEAERERKAHCGHVTVSAPGIIRGFDPVFVSTTEGLQYLFHSADACIPFKTRLALMATYDACSVRRHLEADFAEHGVPLVVRMDRAACHDAPLVASLLEALGVIMLHGPPYYPCYYAQLERQNRDIRALVDALGVVSPSVLASWCQEARQSLNALWPRRTLDWYTPERVWKERPPMLVDRLAFRDDVAERFARLRAADVDEIDAERFAVEDALLERGIIHIEQPRQVLRG